ncbi:MAG TPA: O-antigen ligase family protein [Longimicrobium sp.]|jgi:O-antigen ligase
MDAGQVDPREAKARRVAAALLGVGVALVPATQLRFWGPVGPGELLLVAWCAWSAVAAVRKPPAAIAPAVRPFLLFWTCSLPLLLAGWLSGWGLGLASPGAGRDFLAYVLVASIVACLAAKPWAADEIRRAGWTAIVTCMVVLFPLLLYAAFTPYLGPIRLWRLGRFLGWSTNPNQLTLGLILTPFVALHGFMRYHGARERLGLAALACCSVVVGLAGGSDALVLAWGAGAAVLAVHTWILAVRGGSRRVRSLLIAAPLIALALVIADGRVVDRVTRGLTQVRAEQEPGAERNALWATALDEAAASPVVGLGPGGHARILSGRWSGLRAEAHNILIDWGSATGLLGAILLCALLLHVAYQALRDPPYFSALAALMVFGMAHHYLRHPIVWIYLLLISVAGQRMASPE